MTEPHDPARLRELEERLSKAKKAQEPKTTRGEEHFSQANMAWRMVIELVAGLGIGFGVGFGLDGLLGTTPFLMIIFVGLGFTAGIKTMMRTANEVQKQHAAEVAAEKNAGTPANEMRDENG
ncbi:AtpZ/AtpI family protein [Celeribacter arenosi]|uniref:ATP synthase protein I n=1 Tax=Celeribacter arenosi TaxID=792649 RepID=A0ABP7K775_9RHOB